MVSLVDLAQQLRMMRLILTAGRLAEAPREIHAQVSCDEQVLKGPILGIIHDAGQL